MSTTDIAQSFMGELVAEIWNRAHAESTGVVFVPSNTGGFVAVDTEGTVWLKADDVHGQGLEKGRRWIFR